MGQNLIVTLLGVFLAAFLALIGWGLKQILVNPSSENQSDIKQLERRVATLSHLMTQVILRVEWLEENNPRPHKHQSYPTLDEEGGTYDGTSDR